MFIRQNHILFYDNDTLDWDNKINYDKISLLLLANGNKNVEEEYLKKETNILNYLFLAKKFTYGIIFIRK